MKNRNNTSIEEYTELLSEADFPLKNEDGVKVFPKSFSYVKNENIISKIISNCWTLGPIFSPFDFRYISIILSIIPFVNNLFCV